MIYTDSSLVVQQLRGRWKVKHPGLQPLFRRAQGLTRGYESVRYVHVPRERNERADVAAGAVLRP